MILIMKELNFLFQNYGKIEIQNNICVNVVCYENVLAYPVYLSDQIFEDFMDLLMVTDENKFHYVYIKDFNRFMCNKTKNEIKKYFCKCRLQCFSSEKVLIEHKENYLIIIGKQSVKALKIISNKYLFLLKSMLILNVF